MPILITNREWGVKMKYIYKEGTGEVIEKKSRFIANVYKITSEEEAAAVIGDTKKKYWDARHNCYAYVLGGKSGQKRFSDDGEPSGTAGKPILDILEAYSVRDCLIVVTRYFGGTLLGTGGLIRAYQGAAKEGLEASEIVDVIIGMKAYIDTDYNGMGKIQYMCAEMNIHVCDVEYTEKVHMEMLIPDDLYVQFVNKITDAFSGKVEVIDIEQTKFAKKEDGSVILL